MSNDHDPRLQRLIQARERNVRLFGKANQPTRDRMVVEKFMHCLGVTFEARELEVPENEPPDVRFRDAEFEVKEILEPERLRHAEYKRRLALARAARSVEELPDEPCTFEELRLSTACERVAAKTQALAKGRYGDPRLRDQLDILFYYNVGWVWELTEDGLPAPTIEALNAEGWRSVSFVHFGAAVSCVLVARSTAPEFLRSVEGRVVRGDPAA